MTSKNLLLLLLVLSSALSLLTRSDPPPPAPASPEVAALLTDSLSRRLAQTAPEARSLVLELFTPELDAAFLSPDGQSAVLWLALREPSGQRLAAEPGLALAAQTAQGWETLLPGDPGWDAAIAALPDGMLPLEHSPAPDGVSRAQTSEQALTGYYLPWAAGTARWLEGSISHFQYIPELGYPSCGQQFCGYAYDFTDADHFPLLASKAGTVVSSRDTCSDGSTNCTNYIVLRTAGDGTYQIYLHLAQGTVPNKLAAGTPVQRGEYLGDTDDTGYSTSQHVHFMVTNSIWVGGDGYYWGESIDIRFADVAINNGVPRSCYEVTHFPIYNGATECLGDRSNPRSPANDWFVSGNVGAFPPTGQISSPAEGALVGTGNAPAMLDVTAALSDDVRVTAARLIAKINGRWVEVGPAVTKPAQPGLYDWDVDLCAGGAPVNGPLEVAVRAWDHEGNASEPIGARTIQVDHACPMPASQLNPAESFDSTAVRLSWAAAGTPAGIGSFEIGWHTAAGDWDAANTLVVPGSQRSAWFAGLPGETYFFRLRALDGNGQAEPWPDAGAAETSALISTNPCLGDALEEDDSLATGHPLLPGGFAQANLCAANDPDWFSAQVSAPGLYWVRGLSLNGGAAVQITVYQPDGTTVLGSIQAEAPGQDARLRINIPAAGVYPVQVLPLTPTLMGTQAEYRLELAEAREVYLPLTVR